MTTHQDSPLDDVGSKGAQADTASECLEAPPGADPAPTPALGLHRLGRRLPALSLRAPWTRIILALLVTACIAAPITVYFVQSRRDHVTNDAAIRDAVSAASEGAVALLSYSPDSLDRDFSVAKSHLTGHFLSYYDQFTREIVTPAAKHNAVTTTAVVTRVALEEISSQAAKVLVFIGQSTTTNGKPDPIANASAVRVQLTKVDGKWLISSFDPV